MTGLRCLLVCLTVTFIAQTASAVRPGGRKRMDITDKSTMDTLTNLTTYAMDVIAERRMNEIKATSSYVRNLKFNARVTDAESQIVAGVNYYITVRMNDADCSQQCAVEECNLIIWVKVWENFRNLTKFECNVVKPEGSMMLGAVSEINIDDNSQAALDAVVARINRALDKDTYPYFHKVKKMLNAKRQIVAGNNYKFEFYLAETDCKRNDESVDLDDCSIKDQSKPFKCSASVLDKAWSRSRYTNMKFNCKSE